MSRSDEREGHSFKASGRSDRIGVSLANFFHLFPDDLSTKTRIGGIRRPGGDSCSHCNGIRISQVKNRRPLPWRCKHFRRTFSVRYGTATQDSNLGLQTWLAFYLLATGLKATSRLKPRRDWGVTQETDCLLARPNRETMRQEDLPFSRSMEADEAYVGSLETNKHAHRRLRAVGVPADRALVVGVKNRESGQIAARVVPFTKAPTPTGAIADHAERCIAVSSDEARGCLPLGKDGYSHQAVKHSGSECIRDQAHIKDLENSWARHRHSHYGVYYSMGDEHRLCYVSEFQGCWKLHPDDTFGQIASLTRRVGGCMLLLKELIADGPRAKRNRVAA